MEVSELAHGGKTKIKEKMETMKEGQEVINIGDDSVVEVVQSFQYLVGFSIKMVKIRKN